MSDSEEVFDVERIVDDRIFNGKKQYLIKWEGYPESDNTWEYESNLMCSELLDEYKENKKKIKSAAPPKKTQQNVKEANKKDSSKDKRDSNKKESNKQKKESTGKSKEKDDSFTPKKGVTFSNEWDDIIEEVTGAFMGPNNEVQIQLKFKDGSIGVATNTEVRYKAPFKLLDFYEANLSFPE